MSSCGYLSWASLFRSSPSSRIMFSDLPPLKADSVCSMHQVYSSSVSPFHAKTGTPVAAMLSDGVTLKQRTFQNQALTQRPHDPALRRCSVSSLQSAKGRRHPLGCSAVILHRTTTLLPLRDALESQ